LLVVDKGAINDKAILSVEYALSVAHADCRLAHREIVDGIYDVCLARSIISDKAVYARLKDYLLLGQILKVYQREFVYIHSSL
jgi:hypothetical protein